MSISQTTNRRSISALLVWASIFVSTAYYFLHSVVVFVVYPGREGYWVYWRPYDGEVVLWMLCSTICVPLSAAIVLVISIMWRSVLRVIAGGAVAAAGLALTPVTAFLVFLLLFAVGGGDTVAVLNDGERSYRLDQLTGGDPPRSTYVLEQCEGAIVLMCKPEGTVYSSWSLSAMPGALRLVEDGGFEIEVDGTVWATYTDGTLTCLEENNTWCADYR